MEVKKQEIKAVLFGAFLEPLSTRHFIEETF